MLSALRLRLTALYLFAGLVLVAAVGGSAYGMLRFYFDATTDLALRHELARQLRLGRLPVPADIAAADLLWSSDPPIARTERDDDHDERHSGGSLLDRELAAIYVLTLDAQGQVIAGPESTPPPVAPDQAAVSAARQNGSDIRTIRLSTGLPVRLLTYRVDHPGGPAFLQLGRLIVDQDRILRDMVAGLLGLGAVSTVVLTGISWLLAGRSIRPAREAWERQLAFIASAGHELRAPLTLLRATAEVALRELPPHEVEQRSLWTDVIRDCDHLTRLVADLLLLSRLDAGRLPLALAPIPLAPLFADLARQVRRLADERTIRLVIEPSDAVVIADAERLRQILLILLDNALRHTPAGGEIRLTARPHDRVVGLVVADTGEGIPPEHLPRVFDRFYVVDGARRRGGSGLGLAIAKSLVEAQHGTIVITSQVGRGTRVEVTLPRAADRPQGLYSPEEKAEA
ncbi:MAG: histidine kinase [Chloroflexi bacterium]|nr:histidine kinase [Chloroflexota bacterium]